MNFSMLSGLVDMVNRALVLFPHVLGFFLLDVTALQLILIFNIGFLLNRHT